MMVKDEGADNVSSLLFLGEYVVRRFFERNIDMVAHLGLRCKF